MTTPNSRAAVAGLAILLLSSACGSDSGSDSASASEVGSEVGGGRPLIVDYSPTVSDVPALMYLATHPGVDLLAVTLPGTGEADCGPGVRQTRALLVIAGLPDVPVGCGSDTPMEGDRDWPEAWRAGANSISGLTLPGLAAANPIDAEELLARSLLNAAEPVTIVTLAPLTNLGRVLTADPSLAEHVDSIVTMGGAFDVAGNVEDAPTAEWNLYIDPESVRAVLDSGVPVTFVGLDATNSVPGSPRAYFRLEDTARSDTGEAVRQLWDANFAAITSDGWYFWDELAVVVAMEPSVATIADRSVSIDDDGASGTDPDGVPARVAIAADPVEFERLFLEVFAGGSIPPVQTLSASEQEYIDEVAAAIAALDSHLGRAFGTLEQHVGVTPESEAMGIFAELLFAGLITLSEDLDATSPPGDLEDHHDRMVEVAAEMIGAEGAFLASITALATNDPLVEESVWGVFEAAAEEAEIDFEEFEEACVQLELAAFAGGATSPICISG